MPELAFLPPDDGPAAALATALAEEVGRQDAAALICTTTPPPPRGDRVYVGLQGEGVGDLDLGPAPERTILVLAAPPGGERFAAGLESARRAGAVFHVNAAAVERLLEAGVPARHLQLGYVAAWDRVDGGDGAELEVIRDRGGYLDWPRVLAAIHGGRVVLHERSLGLAPLVAGRHLFVAGDGALDEVAAALRGEPERLGRVRLEAVAFLRDALPLGLAAAALVGAARVLVAQPLAAADSTPGQPALTSK